ncbi:MAG: cell division protein ZapA [Bacteroidaceae bacterium]|nr:cell division protein ZapA [Bacteroidaceae bacterium]
MDKITIKLVIGENKYPLVIERQDEPLFREAAKKVNDILGRYTQKYPGKNSSEYFAMAALHIGFLNLIMEQNNDTEPYQEMMKRVSSTLENL